MNGPEKQKWQKIIAVDFDGCLCDSKWPDIGEPHNEIIHALIREQVNGAKLILWTCREGQLLQAAILWCLNRGLKFDAVNDNLPEMQELYGNNSRKVSATEYWDDRSVAVSKGAYGMVMALPRREGGIVLKQWRREVVTVEKMPTEPQRHRRAGREPKKRRWFKWFDGLRRNRDSERDSDPPSAT